MIRNYDRGILLLEDNWLKRVWKAHQYKNHRLT